MNETRPLPEDALIILPVRNMVLFPEKIAGKFESG